MKYSKLGLVLSGLYIIITAVIFYQAFTCSGEFCSFIALIPVFPWVYLVEIVPFPRFLDSEFGLIIFAIIDTFIIYWLGLVLERWYKAFYKK